MFWISYEDLLRKYQHFDRTRLFGPEWTITQQWTSLNVPWSADYHSTRFVIELTKTSPVVVVLSQVSPESSCSERAVKLNGLSWIRAISKGWKANTISPSSFAFKRKAKKIISFAVGTTT
jgi:hypothetical protein